AVADDHERRLGDRRRTRHLFGRAEHHIGRSRRHAHDRRTDGHDLAERWSAAVDPARRLRQLRAGIVPEPDVPARGPHGPDERADELQARSLQQPSQRHGRRGRRLPPDRRIRRRVARHVRELIMPIDRTLTRTCRPIVALALTLVAAAGQQAFAQEPLRDVLSFLLTNQAVPTEDFVRDAEAAAVTRDTISRLLLAELATLPIGSTSAGFTYH